MWPYEPLPNTGISPRFHEAFIRLFATGEIMPGFADHIKENFLMHEFEISAAAEAIAQDLEQAGRTDLAQLILDAVPPTHGSIELNSPEHREFKRQTAHPTVITGPQLDLPKLAEVMKRIRQEVPVPTDEP